MDAPYLTSGWWWVFNESALLSYYCVCLLVTHMYTCDPPELHTTYTSTLTNATHSHWQPPTNTVSWSSLHPPPPPSPPLRVPTSLPLPSKSLSPHTCTPSLGCLTGERSRLNASRKRALYIINVTSDCRGHGSVVVWGNMSSWLRCNCHCI